MKKFFKFIGIVVLLFILFILVSGIFISRKFHFERSISINAPKEEVWNNISRFENFEKWDPWLVRDPSMKRSISGADGTIGATYSWEGNKEVGSGTQTFTGMQPYEHITVDLHLREPFESEAKVFYHLSQEGNAVKVTWGFDNTFPYPFNALTYYFMDMDGMMDKDFSAGLANLKKLCESKTRMVVQR